MQWHSMGGLQEGVVPQVVQTPAEQFTYLQACKEVYAHCLPQPYHPPLHLHPLLCAALLLLLLMLLLPRAGELRLTEYGPMALAAWASGGKELLAVGDAAGGISLMEVALNTLVGRGGEGGGEGRAQGQKTVVELDAEVYAK